MHEVTKEEFKAIYAKYGRAEDGWGTDYWNKYYEAAPKELKYLVEIPSTSGETRMMVVDDYFRMEVRLFILTERQEERFFDHDA